MSDKKKLVIVVTQGFDNERASVAWSVSNGGIGMDFEVTMFLLGSGVDWVRKGAADGARLNPMDSTVGEMIRNVVDAGSNILVCPPCAKVRGYGESDFIDDVALAGSATMLGEVGEGASTLTF